MKTFLLLLVVAAGLPTLTQAGWWAENDYATGSNGFKKDSLMVFTNITSRFKAGTAASFYRDKAAYRDTVYAFRAPLMYSLSSHFLSLTPFIYPVSNNTHSGAGGLKMYIQTALTEPDNENYFYLTAGGAWAEQSAQMQGFQGRKRFSETAVELKAEKSYFNQFFLLASAAAFSKSGPASNGNLITPALDHAEMADLGTFRQITALPDWVMTAQIARSMKPEYSSHLYIGYSKISYRSAPRANSAIMGIKTEITNKTTLDLAYNMYKEKYASHKNYYKILLRTVF